MLDTTPKLDKKAESEETLSELVVKYASNLKIKVEFENEIETLKRRMYKRADELFEGFERDLEDPPKSYDCFYDGIHAKITRVKPSKINYFENQLYDKLKEMQKAGDLSAQQVRSVVSLDYYINDWDGFKKLMKDHGVKPSELKKFLLSEKHFNYNQLDNLIDQAYITKNDLAGTYEIVNSKPYYRASIVDDHKRAETTESEK